MGPLPLREKDLGLIIPKPPALEESPIMKTSGKDIKRVSTGNLKIIDKPNEPNYLENLSKKVDAFEAKFDKMTKEMKENQEKFNNRINQKFDEILQAMKLRDDQLSTSLSAITNPKNNHSLSNEAQQLTLLGDNMSYMADQM